VRRGAPGDPAGRAAPAAPGGGARASSAAWMAAWYRAYLVPSFSNVSYVCDSRLSCSGCSGACAPAPRSVRLWAAARHRAGAARPSCAWNHVRRTHRHAADAACLSQPLSVRARLEGSHVLRGHAQDLDLNPDKDPDRRPGRAPGARLQVVAVAELQQLLLRRHGRLAEDVGQVLAVHAQRVLRAWRRHLRARRSVAAQPAGKRGRPRAAGPLPARQT
jgi:hypothetical protein